jgi:hypothetical protein
VPLALVGLGLGVLGTGMDIAGNAQSQRAMNNARANETNQQAGLQKQANAVVQGSIDQSTPQVAQSEMDAGQAARNNAWSNLQSATTPVASALSPTAGSPTDAANKRGSAAANTWNELNANAAAKEGSYGDWENQQNIKNANAAQQLGVINSFSQGDASLLPVEMQVASQAGGKLSGWGNILSSIGALAGVAGATGAFKAATALPSAAAANDFLAGAGPVSNSFAATTPAWSTAASGATPGNIWSTVYP